jgi:hypothetical protein|tara:strand:- start:103 stop:591 length:489 start_codon:yes stop_codon:yes gene_type:complete
MKKIVFTRYETKVRDGKSSERWGVSMAFPALRDAFDDHMTSIEPEQLAKAGFSAKAEDLDRLGEPAEQAIAMLACTILTGKVSTAALAGKTEDEIRAYAVKNFVKLAAESKSQKEKIDEAVTKAGDWFVKQSTLMAELFVAGKTKEALTIKAEIEARKKPTV